MIYTLYFLDLRMQVRSSLFTRAVGENHKHQFGEEVYNESNDEYSRTCVTCDFTETYEKMWNVFLDIFLYETFMY